MDITKLDGLALSDALANGRLSAREVMEATLDRIAEVNGGINAIVSLRDKAALLAEAEQADSAPRRGWLHGIPMAIKDLADAKGLPTSKGSPLYAGTMPEEDEPMVARLRAAGAILIGKTNTPEFGLGSHTFNPVFGPTRNPYDMGCSAGGSSGGAAAALATGMVALADGSDMMGSLRNPAAWNNVYGMRPTWGLVPPRPEGEMYFGQLSTGGPMARSPRDLAALLETMAGPLEGWPYGRPTPDLSMQMEAVPHLPRIGWLGDWGGAFPMEDGLMEIGTAAVDEMRRLGWQVEDTKPPFDAGALWEAWCDLRSFSVAGSRRADYVDEARRVQLKPAMLWEIERGRTLTAEALYAASEIRSAWFRRASALFSDHDALVLPSTQVWPFPVEEVHPIRVAGIPMETYHEWMAVVIPASLIGLPVVNLPVGFGANGLPAGVQLIGAPGSDGLLLGLAESWHRVTEWPQNRPACREA